MNSVVSESLETEHDIEKLREFQKHMGFPGMLPDPLQIIFRKTCGFGCVRYRKHAEKIRQNTKKGQDHGINNKPVADDTGSGRKPDRRREKICSFLLLGRPDEEE